MAHFLYLALPVRAYRFSHPGPGSSLGWGIASQGRTVVDLRPYKKDQAQKVHGDLYREALSFYGEPPLNFVPTVNLAVGVPTGRLDDMNPCDYIQEEFPGPDVQVFRVFYKKLHLLAGLVHV